MNKMNAEARIRLWQKCGVIMRDEAEELLEGLKEMNEHDNNKETPAKSWYG